MARRQFDGVADLLNPSRLLYPTRAMAATRPIPWDEGSFAML
jgi:hypothetical protein